MKKDKDKRTGGEEEPAVSEEGARSFAVLLQTIGEGAFHAECSEQMHALTKQLGEHALDFNKAKGSITVKLAVEVDAEGLVTIEPEVVTKTPKPARKRGRFWVTPGGNLSPENPRQQKLPLREVPDRRARAVDPPEDRPARGV